MKKVTALFLVLVLLLCNLAAVSAAPEDGNAVVDVAYVDENGLVALTVSTETPAAAGSIVITYDNRTLTLQDTAMATDHSSVKTAVSSVSCSYVNRPAKAGTLAVFSFSYDAEAAGTTKVSITTTVIDAEENSTETTQSLVLELAAKDSLCPSAAFKDLDTNAWYHEAIDYAIRNGIMNGVSDTHFNPSGTTTRAMFVTILGRIAGVDTGEYGQKEIFSDVPTGEWYSAYVNWASEHGIVNGRGAGFFCPEDPVTRQEMVTILARYARAMGEDTTVQDPDILSAFADAGEIAAYAAEAFAWAVEKEIVNGTGAGLEPEGLANRAQAAQIIYKFQMSFE